LNYIVSWFYLEEEGNESSYMQVNAKSTSEKFQNTYWKCIVSFYYTSLRKNPKAKHIFYTNATHFPVVEGLKTKKFFENNGIEVRKQPLTNQTPIDWHSAWRNQFYVFDILQDLSGKVKEDDAIAVLDSDCIINQNLEELFEQIRKYGSIGYLVGYDPQHVINGINIIQMQELYTRFYNEKTAVQYYGGEFIGIKGGYLNPLLEEYRLLWKKNYELYKEKQIKLNEEAHFLSLLYHKLNLANSSGNKYIKRIWNGLNYNNVQPDDQSLSIYHLPAQKTTGFPYFFNRIIKKNKDYESKDIIRIFDINQKKSKKRIAKEVLTKVVFKYQS